jgi:hypothetical protein
VTDPYNGSPDKFGKGPGGGTKGRELPNPDWDGGVYWRRLWGMCVCVSLCVCVCVRINMYLVGYVCIHVCVCVYVCVRINMYVYISMYTGGQDWAPEDKRYDPGHKSPGGGGGTKFFLSPDSPMNPHAWQKKKVLYMMTVYSKHTMALTFENVC